MRRAKKKLPRRGPWQGPDPPGGPSSVRCTGQSCLSAPTRAFKPRKSNDEWSRGTSAQPATHLSNPSNSMAQAVATVDLTPQSCSVPKPRNFRAQASLRSCRPACEKEGKPLVHSRQNSNRMDSGEVSEAGMQADDRRLTWKVNEHTGPGRRPADASRSGSSPLPDAPIQTMTPSQARAWGAILARAGEGRAGTDV